MRGMGLAKVGMSLCALALFAPGANAQLQPRESSWTQRAMGQYGGRIISGGGPLPSSVELEFTGAGDITGEYGFSQSGERVEGRLDACAVMRPYAISCRWHDRNGEGALEMVFSRDLSSFIGRWNIDATPDKWRSWFGRKLPSI